MTWQKIALLTLLLPCAALADQFTLFDETFTVQAKDVVATNSHLYVKAPEKTAHWPKDWTSPVDYRNGTVHILIEVLEKPSEEPTHWSLCYIGNKAAIYGKAQYGCTGSPTYTTPGIYETTSKMTTFWNNNAIDWTQGLKEFHLVIKGKSKPGDNGQSHAHYKDLSKFCPTKVRIRLVQVSAGSIYNPDLVETKQKVETQTPATTNTPQVGPREFRPIKPR